MKNFTKWMLTAAAMLVAVGTASAQAMNADVPFAFRAGNTWIAAGSYRVDLHGPANTLTLVDARGHYQGAIMPSARIEGGTPGDAKLVFRCADQCTLVQAWSGLPGVNYQFEPKSGAREGYLLEIRLTRPH